jgi:exosortase/archaeosortase family protein
LFTRTFDRRWRIVACAAALALIANWVRVVGLVLIGNATRMRSPLMKEHELFGWVIFTAAMVLFFIMAGRIERGGRSIAMEQPSVPDSAALATGPRAAQPAWLNPVALAAVLTGPLLLMSIRLLPNALVVASPIPGIVAGDAWRISDSAHVSETHPIPPRAWRPAFRGQDSHQRFVWQRGADSVVVDRLVFRNEHQGAELVGGANRVSPDSLIVQNGFFGPLDDSARIVGQAIVRENGRAVLIWYWYRVAGIATSSATKAKLLGLVAFLQRTEGGEAVFVSTPCDAKACAEAAARLFGFVTGRSFPGSTP